MTFPFIFPLFSFSFFSFFFFLSLHLRPTWRRVVVATASECCCPFVCGGSVVAFKGVWLPFDPTGYRCIPGAVWVIGLSCRQNGSIGLTYGPLSPCEFAWATAGRSHAICLKLWASVYLRQIPENKDESGPLWRLCLVTWAENSFVIEIKNLFAYFSKLVLVNLKKHLLAWMLINLKINWEFYY